MFTERERRAMAYALEWTLRTRGNDVARALILPVPTVNSSYLVARALGTMARLYDELLETLS